MIDHNTYKKKIAKLAVYDPDDRTFEGEVSVQKSKLMHLTAAYLAELGKAEELEKEFALTPYKIACKHRVGTNILLMVGEIEYEDWLQKLKDAPLSDGLADLPIKTLEFVEKLVSLGREMRDMRNSGLTFTIDGTEYSTDSDEVVDSVNKSLTSVSLPTIETIVDAIESGNEKAKRALSDLVDVQKELRASVADVESLKAQVSDLSMKALVSQTNVEYEADEVHEIPAGKLTNKKASEIFPSISFDNDFDLPYWEWEGKHPDVPTVDTNYIFRKSQLQRVLFALVTNQRAYLQGHTGSGKTTLIEQVAAALNYPFLRINFDSEITRMDLIGRDTLVADSDGNVTSVFQDGMLPKAMSGPYITCFDELDFVRPDVAYVMQAALEGNGLRITEDGDRIVKPHPQFRMFGTGNTVGQGDEDGMYQGARPQSMAFLDRFTIWAKVPYLNEEERAGLVKRTYPALSNESTSQILQYTKEHLKSFEDGTVSQPISPRGILAICQATVILGSVKEALEMSVLDRANREDREALVGIVDRAVA